MGTLKLPGGLSMKCLLMRNINMKARGALSVPGYLLCIKTSAALFSSFVPCFKIHSHVMIHMHSQKCRDTGKSRGCISLSTSSVKICIIHLKLRVLCPDPH